MFDGKRFSINTLQLIAVRDGGVGPCFFVTLFWPMAGS